MDKERPAAPSAPGGASDPPAPEAGRPRLEDLVPDSNVAIGPFLDGRVLIAMPGIGDPRFERAVLMVCIHDEEQAMAISLNRPMNGLRVPSLLKRLGVQAGDVPDTPVMLGGPCGRDRGYVLHTADYWSPSSSLKVAEGLGLTDTREVLDALGDRARRPRRFLLALGYAGWSAGQLEQEIREGVWLSCEPDETLVFGAAHEDKWTLALAKIGVRADQLSSQAGWA